LFYLPLAILTWATVAWIVDRRRASELLVYGLLGSVLATVQDRLVLLYHLWEYVDTGLVNTHVEISLVISLSAAPVFAARFAQGLAPGSPVPWKRICKFTAFSMLPEIAGIFSGNILYHNGWNVGFSVLAYIPIWTAVWGLHHWMTLSRPAVSGSTTADPTTAARGT